MSPLLSRFLCTCSSARISPSSSWTAGRTSLTTCVPSPKPYQSALSSTKPLQSLSRINRHGNPPRLGVPDFRNVRPCLLRLLTERAELPFCVDGPWAGGVRVERGGSGLIAVWSRQIQQLNRVSPAVASTVTAAYPSPQLLLQVHHLSVLQDGPVELGA